jgi:hypothetical protein
VSDGSARRSIELVSASGKVLLAAEDVPWSQVNPLPVLSATSAGPLEFAPRFQSDVPSCLAPSGVLAAGEVAHEEILVEQVQ